MNSIYCIIFFNLETDIFTCTVAHIAEMSTAGKFIILTNTASYRECTIDVNYATDNH